MRFAVQGVAKINKDDFRKIRIETAQLIEGFLEILLLHGSRYRVRRGDRTR